MRRWFLFVLLLFPALAFGAESFGLFKVLPTDKSMEYLGMALGTIPGTPIVSTEAGVVGKIIYVFNQVVFILGILIIGYTTLVGTLQTAQEGEFLGKSWHPVLVPLRAAFGIYLLLPSASGYNLIQMIVMWFIVQGVGAANALWTEVITYNSEKGNILASQRDQGQVGMIGINNLVRNIYLSNVCMLTLNAPTWNDPNREMVSLYRFRDNLEWGYYSSRGRIRPICGLVSIAGGGGLINIGTAVNDPKVQQAQSIFDTTIRTVSTLLQITAGFATQSGGHHNFSAMLIDSSINYLKFQAETIAQMLQGRGVTAGTTQLTEVHKKAIANGWIHAGSYYFQLVDITPPGSASLGVLGIDMDQLNHKFGSLLSSFIGSVISSADQYYQTAYKQLAIASSAGTDKLKIRRNPQDNEKDIQSIMGGLFGTMIEDFVHQMNLQMTEGEGDPIVSMSVFGSKMITTIEITFWVSLGIIFALWMGGGILSFVSPVSFAMNTALALFLPIAIMLLSLFYLTGLTLGIYIPLIPFLVFTFCAIGWFILVIEALLGASLIALTLVVPSEDEIGKAGHAIVILLGLFLRPAMMILGFIFGISLLTVAIKMLNFGFWETLVSSTGGTAGVGIFGMLAVFVMYAAIATAITHEAFSLIYLVPNKVLRWIGGSPEGEDDVMSKVKESKGSVEKGGSIGKAGMSGVLTKFTPKGK